MSLVKKPTMTEQKLAANQRNAPLSRGPVTPEGKQRSRAAHLRQGSYAKSQDWALQYLGEDPERFEELREELGREFPCATRLQQELVNRLARVLSLMDRVERWQEGEALRRARSVDAGRDNRLHARMMRLKMTAETLRALARAVAEWHYVTTREDLDVMKKLHQQGVMTEMGEIALDLFRYLQEPGADEDGASEEEQYRGAVNSFRSIFGLEQINKPVKMLTPKGEYIVIRPEGYVEPEASPDAEEDEKMDKDDRYPRIAEEDWKPRERARKLLRNILSRQAEACEAERKCLLQESLAGPSPSELAADSAPSHKEALVMRRIQDANIREVRRITNLLLKLQRQERRPKVAKASEENLVSHDAPENTDVSG
jgi:hypothetical protein